jgi:hypothetical protein
LETETILKVGEVIGNCSVECQSVGRKMRKERQMNSIRAQGWQICIHKERMNGQKQYIYLEPGK